MKNLLVKRVYEKYSKTDGIRILIDRLWPRNITKEKAKIKIWAKEIAPPRDLVLWFHGDKENRFKEFKKKYQEYLKSNKKVATDLLDSGDTITLITAVKDIDHSHIPTLVHFLNK